MQPRVVRASTWLNSHKLLLWIIVIWLVILVVALWWGPVQGSPTQAPGE
jgi:hypothetical protein